MSIHLNSKKQVHLNYGSFVQTEDRLHHILHCLETNSSSVNLLENGKMARKIDVDVISSSIQNSESTKTSTDCTKLSKHPQPNS